MGKLSNLQFSRFCEFEAAKLFIFGSGGSVDVAPPMTDDDPDDPGPYLKDDRL
jgi:hypothetical protein